MSHRLLIALTVVIVLALAPQAAAKGIEGATVCGTDGCAPADRDDLGPALMGGTPTMPPTEAGPWYRAKLELGDGRPGGRVFETFTVNVVPKSGYIRSRDGYGGSTWSEMSSRQQAIYLRLTNSLKPFPASELKGVADPEPAPAVTPLPASPAADGSDDSLPWALIAAAGVALAAALWALGLARRRRATPASVA